MKPMNNLQQFNQEEEKKFDEAFKCIQSDCDGNGYVPRLVSGSRQISETEFEQTHEWEADQCQFHAEYLIPMKQWFASHDARRDEQLRKMIVEALEKEKKLEDQGIYCGCDGECWGDCNISFTSGIKKAQSIVSDCFPTNNK